MWRARFMTNMLAALAIATVCISSTGSAAEVDESLRAELENIAQRRIFFGHQSVGTNLLDGIRQLAAMANVPLRITQVQAAGNVPASTLGHTHVAKNGDPLQKLQSFESAFDSQPSNLDMALVKFCYVDIKPDTDIKALFERYRATITSLKAKNPGTAFIHITTPLTTVPDGVKESLKKLLGRTPHGTFENLRREEYNNLLRKEYEGREPLFDLARAESTAPDGSATTVEWKGAIIPVMAPVYTDDGGHLNHTGKLHVARKLVSVLASIPKISSGR